MDVLIQQFESPLTIFSTLVWVLAFAWIAARLIGARGVSGGRILVAGLAGYVAGFGLALIVSGGEVEESVFLWSGTVFSILVAMFALVLFELLGRRRPTVSPARTGIPRPLRAIRRTLSGTARAGRVVSIMVGHGLVRPGAHGEAETGRRLRQALQEAGGVFVKLGQALAGRPDLLPEPIASELEGLRESVPPADREEIRRLLAQELGEDVDRVLESFDPEPFAAASIAQAHHARLPDGTEVIVKIRRPGVADSVITDLRILGWLARTGERRAEWARTYRLVDLVDEFAERLTEELDFRREARNAEELRTALSHLPDVHLPEIHRATGAVLILEELDGTSIGKLAAEGRPIRHPDQLARLLVKSELDPMLTGDRFHADPHPGNVFVLSDGRLGLIDFGATGKLDPIERASILDLLNGIRMGDPDLMASALVDVAQFRTPPDRRHVERAMARIVTETTGAALVIDSATLAKLFQLLRELGAALPASSAAMLRALVTLDSTVRLVATDTNVVTAAEQVVGDYVRSQFEPGEIGRTTADQLSRLMPLIERAPRHLDRIATLAARGELSFRTTRFSNLDDRAFLSSLLDRIVVLVSALAFLAVGVGLLFVTGETPAITEILGYAGLTIGTILLLRSLLQAIRRPPRS